MACLFLLGGHVDLADARRALDPCTLDDLADIGLVQLGDEQTRALFKLAPVSGLLLASDHLESLDAPADVVLGVNPSARITLDLTVRRPVDTALDVGTGSGIQALHAASHVGEVLASDVNERALALARFNAALNAIDNVRWRHGSWFEPADDRRFDLVVSNPPFVISPEEAFLFRDGGVQGDAVARNVVDGAAQHLDEGGFAHVLCNWVVPPGADWQEPPLQWTEGSGCDVLVIRYDTRDVVAYAAQWNGLRRRQGGTAFEDALDLWLREYRRLGIERIDVGAVIMRRSPGPNWQAALDAVALPSGPAGRQVQRIFDGHDRLRSLTDDRGLLDDVYALVEGHRIRQCLTYRNGVYASHPATVRMVEDLGIEAHIDPDALDVVFACDGQRPLRELVAEVAAAQDLDQGTLANTAVDALRELLVSGLVSVVER